MKLLFDQNLSFRLVALLEDLFPGSEHVGTAGLASATDAEVWGYARRGGFVIATKDTDFRQRSFTEGHPPRVVWIRLGNCTTQQIADALRQSVGELAAFEADSEASYLVLG